MNEFKIDEQLPKFKFVNESVSNKDNFNKFYNQGITSDSKIKICNTQQIKQGESRNNKVLNSAYTSNQSPILTHDIHSDDEKRWGNNYFLFTR